MKKNQRPMAYTLPELFIGDDRSLLYEISSDNSYGSYQDYSPEPSSNDFETPIRPCDDMINDEMFHTMQLLGDYFTHDEDECVGLPEGLDLADILDLGEVYE